MGPRLRGSPSSCSCSCSIPFPGLAPRPRAVGLQCQPVLEVERRRRRTETCLSGPAAPFTRRTLPRPQSVGTSGVPPPRLLRSLNSLSCSEAQVTSSPETHPAVPDVGTIPLSTVPLLNSPTRAVFLVETYD
ncbi:hypothetical protein ACRRTK_000151 [Alexandromys fortis]